MTIKFNTEMKTYGLNLTDINGSICDIYVHPSYFDYNVSKLNLTWNVTTYDKDIMVIKLNFSDPLYISKNIIQDQIVFHILDPKFFFISKKYLKDLNKEYYTLRYPIRKQIILTPVVAGFMEATEVTAKVMLNSQIFIFFISLFLAGILTYFLSMINSLQILVHMPLMNIAFPANTMTYFGYLIPLIKFDVLE